MGWLSGWDKRIKCVIDQTKIDTANQLNLPVRVAPSATSGITSADITCFFDELDYPSVDDDFTGSNGSAPDTDKWSELDPDNIADIQSNKLNVAASGANDKYCLFSGKWNLSGDFDIQVDFDVTSLDDPVSSMHYACTLRIEVGAINCRFGRTRAGGGDDGYYLSGSSDAWADHPNADTIGKLRIKRVGGTFTSYYWHNSQWEWDGSTAGYIWTTSTTEDVVIRLYSKQESGSSLDVNYDNFTVNSGTVVWAQGKHPNRKKIAITTSDGATQCYVEIERWDDNNENAELWVKVPSVAYNAGTVFYLYYDADQSNNTTYIGDIGDTPAQNVWDSDFVGVWHMAQDPTGGADCIKDSTSNANHGTPGGSMVSGDLVDGEIGKSLNFDGSKNVDHGDAASLKVTEITLEGIWYVDSLLTVETNAFLGRYNASGDERSFLLCLDHTNGKILWGVSTDGTSGNTSWLSSTNALPTVTQKQIAGVASVSGDQRLYIDGVQDVVKGTWSSSIHQGTSDFYIVSLTGSLSFVDAKQDEIRLSKIARSAPWLKATYYSNWDNLITFGSEETLLTNVFDGKIRIKDTKDDVFDGKLWVKDGDPFDGKLRIKNTEDGLFDGKLLISSKETTLFDGELEIRAQIGSWSAGGSLSIGHDGNAGCGTQPAALCFGGTGAAIKVTEEYNGTSWSAGGTLSLDRNGSSGCGTQTAGLCFGGFGSVVIAEEYNGTLWANGGSLTTWSSYPGGCGTQTAGLCFGGTTSVKLLRTEEYNGTAWSAGGDLSAAKGTLSGCGTQAAGLAFGGYTATSRIDDTEEYNGTSWSAGGDLLVAKNYIGGFGSQTNGVCCGGYATVGGIVDKTEEYNGSTWRSGGDLNATRYNHACAGSNKAGLCFGGLGVAGNSSTEEYDYPYETSLFDGKLQIRDQETDLFDGKLGVVLSDSDLFDGNLRVGGIATTLFDGELEIVEFASSFPFDGKLQVYLTFGVWVTANSLPTSLRNLAGCGSKAAALMFGGYHEFPSQPTNASSEYNGTTWSSGGDIGTARYNLAGCGSQTAGFLFGGYNSSTRFAGSEEYNGTAWSYGGSLSEAKDNMQGFGVQTAAVCAGGWIASATKHTEEYNGTSWSSSNDLIAAKYLGGGCGSQTAGMCFGGISSGYTDATEEYSGSSWSVSGALLVARGALAGCGSLFAGLSFAGRDSGATYKNTEEFWGVAWASATDYPYQRQNLAGCGSQSAGLGAGGYFASISSYVAEYVGVIKGTDFFDGSLRIGSTADDLFDGNLRVGAITDNPFDGNLRVGGIVDNPFDGKLQIRDQETTLFDGRLEVDIISVDLFDGLLGLVSRRGRSNILGGVGDSSRFDFDLPLSFDSRFGLLSPLGVSGVRKILLGLGQTMEYLLHLPMAEGNQLLIINRLSDYVSAIQMMINELSVGDPAFGKLFVFTSLQSDAGVMVLRNELSGIVFGIQSLITALTDGVSSHVSLINELALKDDIHSLLVLLGSMPDPAVLYPDCTLNVYLDGVPIKPKQITSLSFTMDRGVTFDVLSINSTDMRLYASLQMIVGNKDSVIEVQYQGTSWMFLVEEVSGFELSFSVWGRSIAAAKSDAPFKDSVNFVLEEDTTASIVAEDLVPELSVTWNAVDWTILADWSVDGTPVQMLKTLADSIGAVVRSYPDGTGFYVDEKYTTRPVNLPYAASEADFDRDVNLISLDASRDLGTGANAVTVHGHSPLSKYSVRLEADSCVEVGSPAVIKVYPALNGSGYSLIASDGAPTYQHSLAEEHTEAVNFVGGKGSVSYPITALTSITWDGAAPAGFEYTAGQDEIVLTDDTPAAVGEVVYSTRYDVWHGVHSGEGQLLVVCYLDESGGIVARVYFDEGDREADDIDKPILTSIEAAVAAGQAFLDDTSYNRLLRSITAPCSDVSDGDVVCVSSDLSGVTGNTIVLRHEVSAQVDGEALKISSNLEVVQFEV